MAKEIINVGQAANDGTGDPLRNAFEKVNSNFTELYDTADTQDLDFTGDSGTGAVELDSQTLNLVGTNGVQTTANGQTITIDTSSLDTRLTTAEADIDTNTASITTEETARIAADTTLQTNIDAEATTRGSADTTLQTNIDSEAATRLANDNTLQSNIDAEAATRLANDNTLQGNIDTEASTRSSADTALQGQIDSNDTDIATNAANIATNTTNISSNDTDISGLDTRLTTAEGNITSNDTDITGLDNRLTTAEGNISSNDTDIATNASNIATNVTNIASNDTDISNLQSGKQDISEKNQANGYAPLDSGAKIPIANLPDSVVGQVEYQGTWDASIDDPTLPSASTVKGHYYVVSVGGTYETITYAIGDWIISNGVAWEKIDNTDAVTTVFGRLGAIVANEGDYSSYYPLIADLTAAEADITALQNDKYDKSGGTISGNATITGNLIVDTNTLYVDSSTNNVGIGTTSPATKMHLEGLNPKFTITNTNTTASGNHGIIFESLDGAGFTTQSLGQIDFITSAGATGLSARIEAEMANSNGAGTIVFSAGAAGSASERMRIRGGSVSFRDTSNNEAFYWNASAARLGIGTGSSPSAKLDVIGSSGLLGQFGNDNNPYYIQLGGVRSMFGYDGNNAIMQGGTTKGVAFYTGGGTFADSTLERMRITSAGNVGIKGTGTKLGWERTSDNSANIVYLTKNEDLGVNGNAKLHGYDGIIFTTAGSETERMRIDSSGNFGFNETPENSNGTWRNFQIGGANIASRFSGFNDTMFGTGYVFKTDNSEVYKNTEAVSRVFFNNDIIEFQQAASGTAGTAISWDIPLKIDSSGNVGIGVSPSAKLHVFKPSHPNTMLARFENPSGEALVEIKAQNDALSVLQFADSEDGNVGAIQYSHPENSMRFKTADAERMRIDSSGVVQVRNQTPTIQLYNTDASLSLNQTLGDIDFYQSDASDQGVGTVAKIRAVNIGSIAGYGELAFHTGSATSIDERVRIDYQGNVGIGTDSPSAIIDIAGDMGQAANFAETKTKAGFNLNSSVLTGSNSLTIGELSDSVAYYIQHANSAGTTAYGLALNPYGGNVGIGTGSSPSAKLEITAPTLNTFLSNITSTTSANVHQIKNDNSKGIETVIYSSAYSGGTYLSVGADGSAITSNSKTAITTTGAFDLLFGTNSTTRMRILSGGSVLLGKATDDDNTNGIRFAQVGAISASRPSNVALILNRTGSDGTIALFRKNSTQVGSISVTGSATSYVTSSDYRLKENVVEMTGALDRVDALKPSRFNFIADAEKTVDGFLAHEVAEVVPEAITGEKDAVEDYEVTPAVLDDEGNVIEEAVMGTRPVYQGIDQSKLVPLLVGAIQELKAEIETLKSQINN